jgi:hypothetical protein
MKANRILLAVIAAVVIFATPSVVTSPVLAQTDTETQGTTDEQDGNQATTTGGGAAADGESPEALYKKFQTCLTTAEGTEGFASEDDIRTCFTDAGYPQGIDDDNEGEGDSNEEGEGQPQEDVDEEEEVQ